ncbi:MAG: helix-hairpin-helix domain-containing protein [Lachnospiraceae bacterium]|nr:helix-hairpin-helix domain-containing protein [Lachnospiraceae bacterium]
MFCDFRKPMAFFVMVFILFGGCAGRGQTVETLRQADSKESDIWTDSGSSFSEERTADNGTDTEDADSQIYVDVCGAVNAPGVVTVAVGARVFEAIAGAGGLSEDADARYINQARILTDGEQVYIPTKEETTAKEGTLSVGAAVGPGAGSDTANAPGAAEFQDGGLGAAGGQASENAGLNAEGKVNINTADSATLQTLNGIGQTRAEAIILYRETNGAFETIEDIMKVPGIKNAMFDKIKDQITVS